jgi:hypothetical protein
MERLVRSHPCNIMLTYINEPFPNVKNKPHRHLTRPELTEFFKGTDIAVKLNNPDRALRSSRGRVTCAGGRFERMKQITKSRRASMPLTIGMGIDRKENGNENRNRRLRYVCMGWRTFRL